MLRQGRVLRYDSFHAARGEVSSLFSPFKSSASLHSAVRRYLLYRSRHMDGLHKSQQRSWVRSKVSLLLQEARHRQNYDVAEAALLVALSAPELVDTVETTWLKDVLASCRSTEEVRRLDAALRTFADREKRAALLASSAASSASGRAEVSEAALTRIQTALTAFLSRTSASVAEEDENGDQRTLAGFAGHRGRPNTALAVTLGDSDRVEANSAQWAVAERGVARGDWMSVGGALSEATDTSAMPTLPSEEDVSQALVHRAPRATGQDIVPADQRARHALRRLQHQREQQVIAPNPSFLRYFVRQGVVRDEAELMALFTALRARPTQVGFRLHLSQPQGRLAHAHLLPGRLGLAPVPWLPAFTGAYTLDCGADVPYDALLSNRRLLQSLAKERVGAYQSLSSMLPVHLLDPLPGDRVLDVCASPGGKSTLLHDYLVGRSARRDDRTVGGRLQRMGCVVANDVSHARAQELALRLQNWSPHIGITSLRGESLSHLADVHATNSRAVSVSASLAQTSDSTAQFNKVLVDVPCSGEGRMGREVMAWRLWHPTRGLEYFDRQRALLRRAVALCAPGGTVVYATCTLNPIENEAVVAAILRECGDTVRLVTPSSAAAWLANGPPRQALTSEDACRPHLTPGLPSWWVPSRSGGFYRTQREAKAQSESLDPALFPPITEEEAAHPAEAARERKIADQLRSGCWRVLPHHNPGMDGFFLAVFERSGARHGLPSSAHAAEQLDSRDHPAALDSSVLQSVLGLRATTGTASSPASAASLATSLLREKGWLSVPSHHPLVHKYLSPFFTAPTDAPATQASAANARDPIARMAALLEVQDLHGVWSESEGLRLLSGSLLRTLTSLRTDRVTEASTAGTRASVASAALLEGGVLAFNSGGALTESGASLLAALEVPHRVLSLPMTYYSILLANQRLEVEAGLDGEADLVRQAMRTASNGLNRSRRSAATATSSSETHPWAIPLLAEVGGQDGNAIVVLHASTTPAAGDEDDTGRLWAVPVQVRVVHRGHNAGVPTRVELKSLLSGASRHRCIAMLGRIHRARTRLAASRRGTLTAPPFVAVKSAETGATSPTTLVTEAPQGQHPPQQSTSDDENVSASATTNEFVFSL